MCSTLIDSLECSMDDLVDTFEDFVKKSLILMTVAIAAIIAMFLYVLRVITERQENTPSAQQERMNSEQPFAENCRSNSSLNNGTIQTVADNCLQNDFLENSYVLQCSKSIPGTRMIGANTARLPYVSSFDERVLRDIGFTNSFKGCDSGQGSLTNNDSVSKLTMLQPVPYEQQQYPSSTRYIPDRNSCCSVCCADDN